MTIRAHLGLDIGGTACRWVACDDEGRELGRGKASGATGHIFNPAERERLRNALVASFGMIAASGLNAQSITVGLTGYGASVAEDVQALLAGIFGVSGERIIVLDDVVLAYMASFAPGEGHLVSAGTGSIGVHIAANGDFVRVGGRGILIDDAGSGSWIALRALDLIYRAMDRDGSFDAVEALARELLAEIKGGNWHDVRQFIYAGDRGRIGTLAVAVARAANAGDDAAIALLERAGAELAQLAKALIARMGRRKIGFVGGVTMLHPIIVAQIRQSLDGEDVVLPQADAALAAARLQAVGDPRWRPVLARKSSIA